MRRPVRSVCLAPLLRSILVASLFRSALVTRQVLPMRPGGAVRARCGVGAAGGLVHSIAMTATVAAMAAAAVGCGDRHPDQLFDVAQKAAFLAVAERDSDAVGTRACGAPDAVHIAFRDVGQVVVEHVAD